MKRDRRGEVQEMEKKTKIEEDDESSASSSTGKNIVLNDHILFEILLRLPASSVWGFRKVCRSWNSLATDPSFVRLHTRRHCHYAAGPKSMLICCDPYPESPELTLCMVDADVDNNQIFHRNIKLRVNPEHAMEYYGLDLQLSCDGLLCFLQLLSKPKFYYICNPVTNTWTIVAITSQNTLLRGFYFHPSTGEYRLLQYFHESSPARLEAGYEVATVNGGGNNTSWRRVCELYRHPVDGGFAHDSARNLDQLLARYYSWQAPIVMDGNLHWLPGYHNNVGVIVFDTSSEKFRSIPIPFYVEQNTATPTPTLPEIGGDLCIGCPMRSPQDIELWLLKDHKNQEWVPTHTIISDQGISRTPSEDADEEAAGSLLKRWGYDGSQFSLYDLKRKTCCDIHIPQLSYSEHCVGYTESLVTV